MVRRANRAGLLAIRRATLGKSSQPAAWAFAVRSTTTRGSARDQRVLGKARGAWWSHHHADGSWGGPAQSRGTQPLPGENRVFPAASRCVGPATDRDTGAGHHNNAPGNI